MDEVLIAKARLGAPPQVVYRALTDPAELRRWLAEHADVSLPDGRYGFWGRGTPERGPGRQRLLAARANRLLRFGWTLDGAETTAELSLDPLDGGTLLTVRQTGMPSWAELAPTGDPRVSVVLFWGLAMANLADHVEGRDPLPLCDFGPDRGADARAELTIGASPAEVFTSLVDPERLARWGGWEAAVEPRVGGDFTLHAGGPAGKIHELEPAERLTYALAEGQVVRWELAGSGGRTHLTLVHSGFADPAAAAQQEAGWVSALAELRRLHELGAAWRPVSVDFALAASG